MTKWKKIKIGIERKLMFQRNGKRIKQEQLTTWSLRSLARRVRKTLLNRIPSTSPDDWWTPRVTS